MGIGAGRNRSGHWRLGIDQAGGGSLGIRGFHGAGLPHRMADLTNHARVDVLRPYDSDWPFFPVARAGFVVTKASSGQHQFLDTKTDAARRTELLSAVLSLFSNPQSMNDPKQSEFEKAAAEQNRASLFRELWDFMKHNKKWWLLPLVMALLVLGLLVILSGTGLAPFIYTLF